MIFNKKVLFIGLTSIIIIGFVACTKRNDNSSKVNILVPAPFTGDAASYGKVVKEGVEIALSELEGDPVKQKLNVIYQDSKLSTKEIVNIFQQQMALHPLSVVMPVSTGEAMALAPLCNKNKVVLLPPLADGDKLTTARPYFFRISPASSFQGKVLADAIKNAGITKVAVLYLNDAWGQGLSTKFKDYFSELKGSVVAAESCDPNQTNMRTQLQKIKIAKPEAILILLHPTETIPALKQIRELGITAKLYGGDNFSNKAIYTEVSELAQGVVFALPAKPDNVEFRKFNKLYKDRYGTEADINAAASRDAIMLIAEAVKKGASDGISLKNLFDNLTEGYNGATGTIKWDRDGNIVSKKYELFIVKDDMYSKLL
jgi:branched-chain amino acid transport system substrate-binding protein